MPLSAKGENAFNASPKKEVFSYDLQEYFITSSKFSTIEDDNLDSKDELSNEKLNQQIESLRIIADRQYDLNQNIFIAEGNVSAYLNGGVLMADRLEFNKINNTVEAKGEIRFKRGYQYLRANSLFYNLNEQKGFISDVYGILDIEYLSQDLKVLNKNRQSLKSKGSRQEGDIKDLELQDGYYFKIGNIPSKVNQITKVNRLTGSISRWRIEAPLIEISSRGWTAKKMKFTNDPFSPSQTRIEAENVIAKEDLVDGSTTITAEKSVLSLSDSVKVPGGKRFGSKKKKSLWKYEIDSKDRDGLFVSRILDPIYQDSKYKFSIQPQFLIQRSILGENNSYKDSKASVISDSIKHPNSMTDLFGSLIDFEANYDNWEIDFLADISTFNYERILDGTRFRGDVIRSVDFPVLGESKLDFFHAYRSKAWNGSLGQTNIYSASGVFLIKEGSSQYSNLSDNYKLAFGLANYQAEAFSEKKLLMNWRTSAYTEFTRKYHLWRGENVRLDDNHAYRYSPVPIYPEVNFNTKLITSHFIYEEGSYQSVFGLSLGPEIIYGRLERPFFDYTKITIMPGFKLKSGDSPYRFDRAVDLKNLEIELTQQIYGPLLLKGGFSLNIDSKSDNYGNFSDQKYSLLYQKRSYDFEIFYSPYQESGGFIFRMNGFNFNGTGSSSF